MEEPVFAVYVAGQLERFSIELIGLESRIFGESRVDLEDLAGVVLAHPLTQEILAYALCRSETRPDGSLAVYTLAVNPKYRHRGYGTALIAQLTERYGYFSDLVICVPQMIPEYRSLIQILARAGFRANYQYAYVDPSQARTTTTMIRRNPDFSTPASPADCCNVI